MTSAIDIDVAAHIANTDGNWGTSRFRRSALAEMVKRVHFCAHENTDNTGSDGQPATNHWSLFLEISPSRSVRVDVVPGGSYSPGMVVLELKNYNVSSRNVYDAQSEVPQGTTVETILRLIIANGRDRYIFAPIGEGCRFWLWTFAWDMARARLLSHDVTERVSTALGYYWRFPVGSGYEPRTIMQGQFF